MKEVECYNYNRRFSVKHSPEIELFRLLNYMSAKINPLKKRATDSNRLLLERWGISKLEISELGINFK